MKNKLINTSIVFISIFFVIMISVVFFSTYSPDISEQLNTIYSDVIKRNRTMLENPVEYGDEYCSGYVSTKKEIDVHNNILSDLKVLSDEICADSQNDYEKMKAIAYYVAENVYYNHIAADSSVTADTISLEFIMDTKIATCAGYSNLFSALCNMQGIYCVNLRGGTYSVDYETSEHLMNMPINHEWNATLIDNEWIFVDITWLSNNKYTENGYVKSDEFDDQYFGMTLEEMSYEHRIDIIDYRDFKSSINALK